MALLQAQASHTAAMAAMHRQTFAAIEAAPDSPAAGPAVDMAAQAANDSAVGSSAVNMTAEAAGGMMSAYADLAEGADDADCNAEANQKAVDPPADDTYQSPATGNAASVSVTRTANDSPSRSAILSAEDHQQSSTAYTADDLESGPNRKVSHKQDIVGQQGHQAPNRSKDKEIVSLQPEEEDEDTAEELTGGEEATQSGKQALSTKGTSPASLPHLEPQLTAADYDAMLEQQLHRIKNSAVLLPDPAEVIVTDLIDHRLVLLCWLGFMFFRGF